MSCVRNSHHNIPQTLEVISNVFTAPCGRGGGGGGEGGGYLIGGGLVEGKEIFLKEGSVVKSKNIAPLEEHCWQ